jgi:hypothetical protein
MQQICQNKNFRSKAAVVPPGRKTVPTVTSYEDSGRSWVVLLGSTGQLLAIIRPSPESSQYSFVSKKKRSFWYLAGIRAVLPVSGSTGQLPLEQNMLAVPYGTIKSFSGTTPEVGRHYRLPVVLANVCPPCQVKALRRGGAVSSPGQ